MPQTRQITITQFGGPEVLQEVEAALPDPQEGQILIRTYYAGVNNEDVLVRMGLYAGVPQPPVVPGFEVAGKVEMVGSGVTGYKHGDRVMALTRFGGYSGYVLAPEAQVWPVPAVVELEVAATLPVRFLLAYLMLIRLGNVQKGQTVLIHHAGGTVGMAATQVAKLKDARILATVSRSERERVKDLGAEWVIDQDLEEVPAKVAQATQGRGVDLILDARGASPFGSSYRLLAPGGKLIMYGDESRMAPARHLGDIFRLLWQGLGGTHFSTTDLMTDNRGVIGVSLFEIMDQLAWAKSAFRKILVWLKAGKIDPMLDRTLSYQRAPEAQAYVQSRQNFGKVLLDFSSIPRRGL